MAFFDKVKEAGLKGLDKAQDLGAQAKIKLEQEKTQSKIKDLYAETGKALIEKFPDFFKENFAEAAGSFDELQATLAKLAEDLEALKSDD